MKYIILFLLLLPFNNILAIAENPFKFRIEKVSNLDNLPNNEVRRLYD